MRAVIQDLFKQTPVQTEFIPWLGAATTYSGPGVSKQHSFFRRKNFSEDVENLAIASKFPDREVDVDQHMAPNIERHIDVTELATSREVIDKFPAARRELNLECECVCERQSAQEIMTDLCGFDSVVKKNGLQIFLYGLMRRPEELREQLIAASQPSRDVVPVCLVTK